MSTKRTTQRYDIWTNAFNSGSEIQSTTVKNGMQSRTSSSLSEANNSGRATIAFSLTAALVALIQGRVSVGKTAVGYYCECSSANIQDRKYVVRYSPKDDYLEGYVMENGQEKEDYTLADGVFSHWSIFVPRIVQIIDECTSGEFISNFSTIRQEFETNNYLDKTNSLFILNDYLYETRHEYITKPDQARKVDPFKATIKEDISSMFTQNTQEFTFAKSTKTKASSTTKKKAKTNGFELNWGRELTDEEKELVPNLDFTVIKVAKEVEKLANIVKCEHNSYQPVNNILLYGEAGAGKSTGAKILSKLWGVPYRFTNLSLNSEESDIIGSYRPKDDGTFEFIETAFVKAFRDGGVFEAVELNYAKPGVLGCLNAALDDTGMLTTGNGQVIKRHPNFIFVATTNVDYAGCQKLNEAFKDRFQQMVKVEKLPDEDLVDIVVKNSGNTDIALVKKLIDAVNKISIKIKEEQLAGGVCSTRQLINWARDIKYTGDPIESAKGTILPGVALDEEIHEEIIDTILKQMF